MSKFEEATDYHQYDADKDGKPIIFHNESYWQYLKPYSAKWKDKNLLDIGSGNGWVLDRAHKVGANIIVGIEPAESIAKLSKEKYPFAKIVNTTFEEYNKDSKFDVIIAIMSFNHIADVNGAFQKISDIINPDGEVILIIDDFEYTKTPRFDYEISTEDINDDEYVVSIRRGDVVISDVVRTTNIYKKAAEANGLILADEIAMSPSDELIKESPKYKEFKDVPLTRLLRFIPNP